MPFVREEGVWKIDKVGYANQMMKDILKRSNDAFGGDNINKQNPAFEEEIDDSATPEEHPKE